MNNHHIKKNNFLPNKDVISIELQGKSYYKIFLLSNIVVSCLEVF